VTVRLVVHVVPRAKRTEVAGRHGDALKIKLKAPPVDGAANAELVRFVAEQLGVRLAAVTITSGLTSRRKIVVVAGIRERDALGRLLAGSER